MRVLILAGYTRSLINFRGKLMQEMLARGHEVHASGPEPDTEGALGHIGGIFHQLPIGRGGTNPLADIGTMLRYRALIRQVKPDVLFCYTIKPNIYGGLVGKRAGAGKVYCMVTGLGNAFIHTGGMKRRLIRMAAIGLYKAAEKRCDRMIFQNPDDRQEFINMGIVGEEKTALVNGSGVDMAYFEPSPLPEKPVFLMVSRLLREKGVVEYLQAARMVKGKYPEARMLLLGPYEQNGFALREEDIRPFVEDGSIEHLGEAKDVRPYYEMASVVVLPSYREGTPRTMLEAMTCGRAIITTDVPGCRETVLHEKNGLKIPVRDAKALAEAMLWMLEHPERIAGMGQEGLEYCKTRYAVETVNEEMLAVLGL